MKTKSENGGGKGNEEDDFCLKFLKVIVKRERGGWVVGSMRERRRETASICVRVRAGVCACVRVLERVCMCVHARNVSECVCAQKSVCVRVCVCV